MLDHPPPGKVTCPVCRKEFDLTGQTAGSLPTNQHALHVIALDTTNAKLHASNTMQSKLITKLEGVVEEVTKTRNNLSKINLEKDGTILQLNSTITELEKALKNER